MDLRVVRTKRSIINAFIELRAKKPLEKITVKELADLAFINKATFYQHYQDIYDLAETLENEAIESVLKDIPHPEYLLTNPKEGFRELADAMASQNQLFGILFSGSRSDMLINRLEDGLRNLTFSRHPEYIDDLEFDLLLTVLIQGCFRAFLKHAEKNYDAVIEILADMNECLITKYR
ncbi:MAG: TetR/AcrR family transcriptional regulator [Eubacteriales bacterium]|nr:TetR/AcrR family transcriptional regulator [Eubacteriales bacterium]